MPSTFSPSGIELQAAGENLNSWGDPKLNNALNRLNYLADGYIAVAITGDYTLTTSTSSTTRSDLEAYHHFLKFTGTTAAVATITVPAKARHFFIWNATNRAITISMGAGTTVSIDSGDRLPVWCDGLTGCTTVYFGGYALKDYIAAITASAGAVPGTTGHLGKFLKVTVDGGAPTFQLIMSSDIGDFATAIAGKQTVWVPAGAMVPRTTNGAATGLSESATNKIMSNTLDFDQSTIEYAQFQIGMPKSWNEGTLTAEFVWTCGVTGNVIWGVQGVCVSDDDVLDVAFGTAQEVTDAVTATTDVMQSAETSAMTMAGTPVAKDLGIFQVYRKASDGGDTAAGDAKLLGVRLYLTTDTGADT
jgi:hypothetical protein